MKVTIDFMGGLGNQLFQLAFLEYISKNTGSTPCIERIDYRLKHSPILYFDCIFSNWKYLFGEMTLLTQEFHEDNAIPEDLILTQDTRFIGYFQNYKYITSEFISKLTFDTSILLKYPDIQNKVFIHIRGGDYLEPGYSWLHNTTTDKYYQTAITLFPNTEFIVFTNDIEYVKSKPFLNDYPIIIENEIDTLLLMSKCSGCICANSTFSWWGAYLNQNRQIVLPSKWVNTDMDASGYYFDGCTIVEV